MKGAREMLSPIPFFHSLRYLRSNARRLEHLAALALPIEGRSVLEVGAGIGDLTPFFLDRDCIVTSAEPREPNIAYFRERYAEEQLWEPDRLRIVQTDIESLANSGVGMHDIVFCYGAFNELGKPSDALRIFSDHCRDMLILEVAVHSGIRANEDEIAVGLPCDPTDLRASITGEACVPTRRWVFRELQRHFEHVYMPLTQPIHDRFRCDWRTPDVSERPRHRAIFVATRSPLANPGLIDSIPDVQYHRLSDITKQTETVRFHPAGSS